MSAMNPTPQESFSCAGSNKPKPCAPIVVLALLALLAHPRRACTARSRFGASLPAPPLLPSTHAQEGREGAPEGEPHSRRQPSCRLAASGCLFRRRPTRPRPGGWSSLLLLPLFLIRSRRGHGTHAWAKNWDSNAVLCGTWQIPGANTRATVPSSRRYVARKGERIKAFGFGPFAARSSAMSGDPSGPRQARKRNGRRHRRPRRPRFGACGGLTSRRERPRTESLRDQERTVPAKTS